MREEGLRFGVGGSSGQLRRGWNAKSSSVQLVEDATRDRRCRGSRARQLSSGELTNVHSTFRKAVQVISSMKMDNGVDTTSYSKSLCVISDAQYSNLPPT